MKTEVHVGRIRSVVLLIVLSLLTLNLYYLYWLYRLNAELRAYNGKGSSGGLVVVLFVFLPVVGWFLATWLTARSVLAAQVRAEDDRPVSTIVPSLYAALAPIIGWYVAAGYLQGGANRSWARTAHALDGSHQKPTAFRCPTCQGRFDALINPILPRSIECPSCHRTAVA